jgi:microcystin-dependent protein
MLKRICAILLPRNNPNPSVSKGQSAHVDRERRWLGPLVLAALAQGASTAKAQTDSLIIEKDGTVKIDKGLQVGGDVRAASYSGKGAVPVGAILMWSGSTTQLPDGWVLCDGRNGTPDLAGRFIVGYNVVSAEYNSLGNQGGEARHTLMVDEMPSHSHDIRIDSAGEHRHAIARTTHGWDIDAVQSGDPRNGGWRGQAYTENAGAHTHSAKVLAAGGGKPFDNRPPYYVLAYIMYKG